jgi:cell division septation protein DedD
MQIEENLPPAANDPRRRSAGSDFTETPHTQQLGALAPQSKGEEWSAFAPSCDLLEDVLMIPEEPHAVVAPIVEAEVLEDVFGSPGTDSIESVTAVVIQPSVEAQEVQPDEQGVLHASLMPYESETKDATLSSVESLSASAPVYDKYAVGMRILRISPVWLLLSTFGFISIILLFGWMFRPAVNADAVAFDTTLKNEATNSSPLTTSPAPAAIASEAAPIAEPVAETVAVPVAEQPAPAQSAPAQPVPVQAAPAPQREAVAATAAVEPSGNFTVQVGSYNEASQANERVSVLRASGVEARAAAVEIPKRGTWYRVQAGRFQTREEATRFGAQLRARGAAENVIVAEVK